MDTSGLDHLFNSSVNYRACLCTEDIQHHPSTSVGDFGCYCGLLFQLCLVLLCHSQATVASRSAPFDRVCLIQLGLQLNIIVSKVSVQILAIPSC
jgi:hypothetical protein